MSSGNRDYHYTHWTILPDRFADDDLKHLSDSPPIPPEHLTEVFYCTDEDHKLLKYEHIM